MPEFNINLRWVKDGCISDDMTLGYHECADMDAAFALAPKLWEEEREASKHCAFFNGNVPPDLILILGDGPNGGRAFDQRTFPVQS